jgi:hypothetical protein
MEETPVTIAAMAKKESETPAAGAVVDQKVVAELVARASAEGVSLTGEGGLLQQLTKLVLESSLEGEMDAHLAYAKHEVAGRDGGNSRNGRRPKTVLTEVGPVEVDVPRDRDGSFEPVIVRKRQRRLDGVDGMVLSLSAKGLTTGEISAHLAEVYGASVSKAHRPVGEAAQFDAFVQAVADETLPAHPDRVRAQPRHFRLARKNAAEDASTLLERSGSSGSRLINSCQRSRNRVSSCTSPPIEPLGTSPAALEYMNVAPSSTAIASVPRSGGSLRTRTLGSWSSGVVSGAGSAGVGRRTLFVPASMTGTSPFGVNAGICVSCTPGTCPISRPPYTGTGQDDAELGERPGGAVEHGRRDQTCEKDGGHGYRCGRQRCEQQEERGDQVRHVDHAPFRGFTSTSGHPPPSDKAPRPVRMPLDRRAAGRRLVGGQPEGQAPCAGPGCRG